ncbi:hypothetical protein [Marinicellulosiphila megalodicopiae]|uniref:hypothetical protein n=1 Tax=Marinicellulosiphila megalodicopiae TaxID=2724896 RepID=UPI003BAED2B3
MKLSKLVASVIVLNSIHLFANSTVIAQNRDVIKTVLSQSENDQRAIYLRTLLTNILDATVKDYGSYTIQNSEVTMSRNRGLQAIQEGQDINVYIAPADVDWEDKTLPLRIPIYKGLLNYRILLTNDRSMGLFANVNSIEDLKFFELGLNSQWTTTKIMSGLGFKSTGGTEYDNLFKMLNAYRFDYIPRGMNEIFVEFPGLNNEMENLRIENTLALYIPLPVYFYTSKQHPKIASRLNDGFKRIIEDGSFEKLFNEFFHKDIQRANLQQRKILLLGNPLLSPQTPFDISEYWFYPIEKAVK